MNIKIESINKALSSIGGLCILQQLVKKVNLEARLSPILPTLKAGTDRSYRKFVQLLYAFQAGADCLDDINRLAFDPGFSSVCDGQVYSAKACGDFLRSFTGYTCFQLCQKLIDCSFSLRPLLHGKKQKSFTLDLDSTSHLQHGKKMEGLAYNYKGNWGLDSIMAFDEFGLQYWHDVRPGNTASSQGAECIIHEIYNRMPKNKLYKKLRRYLRADSAFCHSGVFNACMAKEVGFVITMKENMYRPLIANVSYWHDTNPKNKDRIIFYDKRECQIGQTLYYPGQCHKALRVVLMRAVKKEREHLTFKHSNDYDYYAWVTNIGDHEMSNEKIIKFYRKRGNAENHIKQLKYGLDLKHYPCQKIIANKAYGIIAAFAYTLMRFLSVARNKQKPLQEKAIRFRWINLPCQVVLHARQVVFRFMKRHHKEVKHCLDYIKNIQLGFA